MCFGSGSALKPHSMGFRRGGKSKKEEKIKTEDQKK
jgi:hypothetical protein